MSDGEVEVDGAAVAAADKNVTNGAATNGGSAIVPGGQAPWWTATNFGRSTGCAIVLGQLKKLPELE